MTQTTDTINFQEKANFIWQVADDILFGPFMHNEFRDVVLPFVVLRRLDCIYTDEIRERVQKSYRQFKDVFPSEDDLEPILLDATGGLKFYNVSDFNLVRLAGNAQAIEENFDFYLKSYGRNVRDILQNFKLEGVIAKLIKNNLLYQLVSKFTEIDLHPSVVKNHEMGYIYEHLLYKFNQFTGETAGHHYTPREVIRLMCNLLFAEHGADLQGKGIVRDIFDPACGSGGMLTIAKDHILAHINPDAEIRLFGQELNEQTYAVSKSDFLVTGEEPSRIREGDSFTNDQFKTERFRYMLCNPPFGVNWKSAQAFIEEEAKNPHGRFFAGTPRVNDGALLFLQHMISKMEAAGSRIAIVFNGSPLFTGEAGGGESNIRKWIIENDMLEAIVALPDQMFYNTGINTYIWIVTNRKLKHRKGQVQLINGVKHFQKMRKSLGDKRNELSPQHIRELTELYTEFEEGKEVRIFDKRLIELLEEKRSALITQSVTKGLNPNVPMRESGVEWLGRVPEHWEVMAIKRLARPGRKTFVDGDWIELPYITEEGVRLIQTGNVGTGAYREKGFRYVSETTFRSLKCTEVEPGNVLICRLDGPVGRGCLAPDLGIRMITSVDNTILKPDLRHDPRFIVYFLSCKPYLEWNQVLCRVGGGHRWRISRSMLGDLRVPVPPSTEQKQIADFLDKQTAKILSTVQLLQQQIDKLQEYRQSVITAAVTGKLDVTQAVAP
ncbi:MAG: N-6 DNA methylase [Leptolyngbya sp. UWPOB_LEPTO1]|uniref:N-6 DNA methylase n=1 Tax=Leptolyngbya sp. UWPOB_LEPTO1 TaxID=2815653 RepID=UPI001AC9FC5F|nr:N-6 DNA methylase [Leptolyngbya sp. UWPOB_LEPTO1]MBN8564326.1 N-6 DNA methylase [Leptolyngbya sp. UWPOB_LEPTO1]